MSAEASDGEAGIQPSSEPGPERPGAGGGESGKAEARRRDVHGIGRSRARRVLGLVARYALLTVLAFVVLFPIYITIVNSLLRPEQITKQPPLLFPKNPQWQNYPDAWNSAHMSEYLKNSFIVTAIITVGQVVTAILAGTRSRSSASRSSGSSLWCSSPR